MKGYPDCHLRWMQTYGKVCKFYFGRQVSSSLRDITTQREWLMSHHSHSSGSYQKRLFFRQIFPLSADMWQRIFRAMPSHRFIREGSWWSGFPCEQEVVLVNDPAMVKDIMLKHNKVFMDRFSAPFITKHFYKGLVFGQ